MIPPGKKHSVRLCATFVRTVNVPGRYGDGYGGHGLSLLVTPRKSGGLSKTWAQAISPNGTKTSLGLGLGSFPVVTLAMARERALANARAIAEGRDPRRLMQKVPTFAKANETVVAIHAAHWKSGRTEGQWRASMRDYVLPRLARKCVDAVTTADVMAVLLPIWSTKRVTAGRVRQRIGAVMKWAVAQGYRDDNPAGDAISAALPKAAVRKQHMRALPHAEVAAALQRVKGSGAYPGAMLAFEFLVLTAARSGEVRNARWEQIDRAGAVWTIPAERMKAGREHRVPLSPRALEVLDGAAELFDGAGLVFPSPTGAGAEPRRPDQPAARPRHRRRRARVSVQLSGLGGRVHGRTARGVRARPGPRQQRPGRGRVPAQRPVRPAAGPDERLGRIRRLTDCAPPVRAREARSTPPRPHRAAGAGWRS